MSDPVYSLLVYLGRYLYRGVLQEKDIVACDKGQVTFRYRDAKTRKMAFKTVPGARFLWLILQHVLPKGFRRARNFGFLHPNSKRLIALLHLLLKFDPSRALAWVRKRPPLLRRPNAHRAHAPAADVLRPNPGAQRITRMNAREAPMM